MKKVDLGIELESFTEADPSAPRGPRSDYVAMDEAHSMSNADLADMVDAPVAKGRNIGNLADLKAQGFNTVSPQDAIDQTVRNAMEELTKILVAPNPIFPPDRGYGISMDPSAVPGFRPFLSSYYVPIIPPLNPARLLGLSDAPIIPTPGPGWQALADLQSGDVVDVDPPWTRRDDPEFDA